MTKGLTKFTYYSPVKPKPRSPQRCDRNQEIKNIGESYDTDIPAVKEDILDGITRIRFPQVKKPKIKSALLIHINFNAATKQDNM